MRRLVIAFVLVAAGIIGWLYWTQSRPERFIVSGLVEADQIRVGSRVGGRVAEEFGHASHVQASEAAANLSYLLTTVLVPNASLGTRPRPTPSIMFLFDNML